MPVRCEPIQLQHQNSPSHRWARYRILPIPSCWRSLQMQLFARHCWSSSRARTYLHPGRRAWNWRCNCSRGHEHPEQGAAHSADRVATSSWRFYEQPRRYSIRYGRCFVSYMHDIIGAWSHWAPARSHNYISYQTRSAELTVLYIDILDFKVFFLKTTSQNGGFLQLKNDKKICYS